MAFGPINAGQKFKIDELFSLVYPVGAIYMSTSPTSPAILFGGSWERIEGKFLLAATDGGSSGDNLKSTANVAPGGSGGEAAHTLSSFESGTPEHSHGLNSHVHGLNSHTHSINHGHEFTQPSVTVPDHIHKYQYRVETVQSGSGKNVRGGPYYYTGDEEVTVDSNNSGGQTVNATGGAVRNYTGASGAASGNTAAATGNTAKNPAASASEAHNTMPPFLAVYVWKRVS